MSDQCDLPDEGIGRSHCCLHDLPRKSKYAPGKICCWCGLIYMADYEPSAHHGEYEPGLSKTEEKKREATARKRARELAKWEKEG